MSRQSIFCIIGSVVALTMFSPVATAKQEATPLAITKVRFPLCRSDAFTVKVNRAAFVKITLCVAEKKKPYGTHPGKVLSVIGEPATVQPNIEKAFRWRNMYKSDKGVPLAGGIYVLQVTASTDSGETARKTMRFVVVSGD